MDKYYDCSWNWKMNLNISEAIELSNRLLKHNEVLLKKK